jgi:hypothetical protein
LRKLARRRLENVDYVARVSEVEDTIHYAVELGFTDRHFSALFQAAL